MVARRRRLIWFLVPPSAVVGLVAVTLLVALVRGTWADTSPRDPVRSEDGPACQLLRLPDGSTEARCAIVLPHPLEEVWEAITDYEHYGDICSYIQAGKIEYDPAGPIRIHAVTTPGACAPLDGNIPFTVEMRFEKLLDEYSASWDQPSGDVVVNRGRWVLRPRGQDETLLTLSMEVQVRRVPAFILNNFSLSRVKDVVCCTQRRLANGPSGKSW